LLFLVICLPPFSPAYQVSHKKTRTIKEQIRKDKLLHYYFFYFF